MSDYDPNRLDPNRIEPRDSRFDSDNGFNWNWVLGGIAAIVLLLVALNFINDSERTAEGIAPSEQTTGQSAPRSANPNQ